VVQRARGRGLIDRAPVAAVDATGLETRHVSACFGPGRLGDGHRQRAWPNLTAVFHTASLLILGAVPDVGPSRDSPDFAPALRRILAGRISARILADRLRQLQSQGLVARDQRPDGQREVAYSLTPQGLVLHGMLRRMEEMLETIPLPEALVPRSAPPGRDGSPG
jgi:DNA-binding HxlR family transcriptional regulator